MSPSANSKLDLSSIDIERIVREVLASVLPAMPAPQCQSQCRFECTDQSTCNRKVQCGRTEAPEHRRDAPERPSIEPRFASQCTFRNQADHRLIDGLGHPCGEGLAQGKRDRLDPDGPDG